MRVPRWLPAQFDTYHIIKPSQERLSAPPTAANNRRSDLSEFVKRIHVTAGSVLRELSEFARYPAARLAAPAFAISTE